MEKIKENSKDIIKKRLMVLKNPLVLILILGFLIRIFYFFLTYDQNNLWWDESLYGNYARYFSGHGPYVKLAPVRPILFSLVWAGFNFISTSEFLPKFFILISSMFAILGMYYLGKSMSNKKIGWFAAFLTAIFYIHIFYTQRLLVDTLSFTFFIWSALFFFKYFKEKNNKYFYIASVIVAIGFLFKITTALILLVVLIYTATIDGTKMFKKKEYYIGALIFLAIIAPYIIWGYFQFDGFILTKAFETNAPTNFWVGGYSVLITYIAQFLLLLPNNWAIPTGLLFIVGIIMMHECIVGVDLMREGDKKLQKDFFLLLMFIIPLVAISFLLNHDEDRYIFNVFPAIFILISIATVYIQELLNKKWKYVGSIFIVLILCTMLISQFQITDLTIKNKISSYSQVKEAGLWMGQNSNPNDIIVTHSYPQVQYYSWRYSRHFPKTEEEFEQLDQTNFTYFMISIFEKSPEWAYQYPAKKNLTVANAWLTPDGQPIVVVYNLK